MCRCKGILSSNPCIILVILLYTVLIAMDPEWDISLSEWTGVCTACISGLYICSINLHPVVYSIQTIHICKRALSPNIFYSLGRMCTDNHQSLIKKKLSCLYNNLKICFNLCLKFLWCLSSLWVIYQWIIIFFWQCTRVGPGNIRLLLGLRIINNNTWVMPGSGLILVEGYLILMRCKRKVRAGAGRLRSCFADASTAWSQFC